MNGKSNQGRLGSQDGEKEAARKKTGLAWRNRRNARMQDAGGAATKKKCVWRGKYLLNGSALFMWNF